MIGQGHLCSVRTGPSSWCLNCMPCMEHPPVTHRCQSAIGYARTVKVSLLDPRRMALVFTRCVMHEAGHTWHQGRTIASSPAIVEWIDGDPRARSSDRPDEWSWFEPIDDREDY